MTSRVRRRKTRKRINRRLLVEQLESRQLLSAFGSLAGFVYLDANDDGIRQGSEPPIARVRLRLTGTTDRGQAVRRTTTTDRHGAYAFSNLAPGTYTLAEKQPARYMDGQDRLGTQGGTAGDDVFSNIVLRSGMAGVDNNFAELRPASLAGFVYVDANNDGTRQPSESPIKGVQLTLTGTNDRRQAVSLTKTTNRKGAYTFSNVAPGTYTLTEKQPAGYVDGKDRLGTQGGTAGDYVFSSIVLRSGMVGVDNNFAELRPASLAGFVYVDGNNDGVRQSRESPIAGVQLTVTGMNDRGQAVNQTKTTNMKGAYTFSNLAPGTYTLTETQPAGYRDGKDRLGTPSGTAGDDIFSSIVLAAGTIGGNNNFGELPKQARVADSQSVATHEDTPQAITLSGSGVAGDPATYAVLSAPAHGALSGTAPNLMYAPAADYNGADSFTFQVHDGTLDSSVATVSIDVSGVNDPPVRLAGAVVDLAVAEDSGSSSLGLEALAYGPGGGADEANQHLTYTITAVPDAIVGVVVLADGTTVVTANTEYTLSQIQGLQFQTATNANTLLGGPATFGFSVTDDGPTNGGADPQTLAESLTITVREVNDPPLRTAGTVANLTVSEEAGATGLGLQSVSYGPGGGPDETSQNLTYQVTALPDPALGQIVLADGTTVVTANTSYTLGQLQGMQFVATADGHGTGTFSYSVTDDGRTNAGRIDWSDFQYVGAFRLPYTDNLASSFSYGAEVAAYNPWGDGGKGTLLIKGHPYQQMVAEVSIPTPVPWSNDTSVIGALPFATVLRPFADVAPGYLWSTDQGATMDVLSGIVVATPPASDTAKLFWTVRNYFNVGGGDWKSHGVSSLDLSNPNAAGLWNIADARNNASAGYLGEIPADFADAYLNGFRIVTGQAGVCGQGSSSFGPAAFAIAPWTSDGTPPADGTNLPSIPLVYYPSDHPLPGFKISDDASSAQWVRIGDRQALMFTVLVGLGQVWYGNGAEYPYLPGGDPVRTAKSYHAPPYEEHALFYDPADLLKVVRGELNPWDVEPYQDVNLTPYLRVPRGTSSPAVFDPVGKRLFFIDPSGDPTQNPYETYPVIHVFQGNTSDQADPSSSGLPDPRTLIESLTITVTSVNDAPMGSDGTVTMLADTEYTFQAADFGFANPQDSPANAFAGLQIATLPALGTLSLAGVPVSAGDFVSVAELNANQLTYRPPAGAAGSAFSRFTFQVRDDGGTFDGGVDLDPLADMLLIDILDDLL